MTADDVAFNLAGQNEALSLTGFLQRVARGEDAAESASSEQGKTSAATNGLLEEVRDVLQQMADSQNASAARQTGLLEMMNAQLEANNQEMASAAVWSGTSTSECETTGCSFTIQGRGFIGSDDAPSSL
jgi:ABC-type transporter Mla subunit MlaD